MNHRSILTCAVLSMMFCAGCSRAPGRPGPNSEVIPPSQVLDFHLLYSENCGGCHGRDGKSGTAISWAIPSSSRLPMMLPFAGQSLTAYRARRCPPSQRRLRHPHRQTN